jgi:hypothetical protein
MGKPKVAVGPAHGHPVLQVLSQGQVLLIVPYGLLEVAKTVVGVAKEVTCLCFTLIELLHKETFVKFRVFDFD